MSIRWTPEAWMSWFGRLLRRWELNVNTPVCFCYIRITCPVNKLIGSIWTQTSAGHLLSEPQFFEEPWVAFAWSFPESDWDVFLMKLLSDSYLDSQLDYHFWLSDSKTLMNHWKDFVLITGYVSVCIWLPFGVNLDQDGYRANWYLGTQKQL